VLVIVPARGGSKGLPQKNVILLDGVPLIQHTLVSALRAKSVNRVIVSTDDDEIASIALAVDGVEVPFMRPTELASDDASAVDVYLHALDWIDANEAEGIKDVCVLLPTSPLRLPDDIDGAVSLYRSKSADAVLSVQKSKPIAWQSSMDANCRLSPIVRMNPEELILNRQRYQSTTMVLNGSIYVLNVAFLRRTQTYFGPSTYGYLMPAERSIDIDDIDDFRLAEVLIKDRSIYE
jgi:CMP-N,N'-diacetyllegionaminic acid synthase